MKMKIFSKKNETKVIKEKIENILKNAGIKFSIEIRLKSNISIQHKIIHRNILPSQVLDTVGIRIITENVTDCYKALQLIINNWKVMESKIKDYIAIPKANGYQSLHLTIVEKGYPIEIQIRTWRMDYKATFGQCSHRNYKKNALR